MNHIEKYNWDTGMMDPIPVSTKVIEKFVNFFLNSKAYVDDIDLVNLKVRQLRRDLANTPVETELEDVVLATLPVSSGTVTAPKQRLRQARAS